MSYKTEPFDTEKPFEPRKGLSIRYSIENMAKSAGLSVDDFKKSVVEHTNMKNEMINKYIDKGYTLDQATTTVMRILYLPGFSGPTFRE